MHYFDPVIPNIGFCPKKIIKLVDKCLNVSIFRYIVI